MFTDLDFSGDVVETPKGKVLQIADTDSYHRQLQHFKTGKVTIRLSVDRGKRSNQANRYYRLCLGLISDHTGMDADDLHEFYKRKFQTPRLATILGQTIEIWTTADNDPEQFARYTDDVRRHALMDLEVATPDPDPRMRGKSRHAKRKEAA